MGFLSNLFSKTEKDKWVTPKQTPQQKMGLAGLADLATRDLHMDPAGVAPLSDYEKTGLNMLGDYTAGRMFQDPRESPMYAGLRQEYAQNKADTMNAATHRLGANGMRNSKGLVGLGEVANRADSQWNSLVGQLYDTEMQRNSPQARMAAAFQYGSLPRLMEQQALNNQFNADQWNQTADYQYLMPLYQYLSEYNKAMFKPGQTKPSGFANLLGLANAVAPLAASAAPMVGGLSSLFSGGGGVPAAAPMGGITGSPATTSSISGRMGINPNQYLPW